MATHVAVTAHKLVRGVSAPSTDATSDWREPLGSEANSRRVSATFTVAPLVTALSHSYLSDAHLVSYQLSPSLTRQPRLNKSSLPWLATQGFTPQCSVLVADVDNDNHATWTTPMRLAWLEQWNSLPVLATCGAYETTHGLRLLQPLDSPVDVETAELVLDTWLSELEAQGLKPDRACRDWTRLYRLPNVIRDGVRYTSPWLELSRLTPRKLEPALKTHPKDRAPPLKEGPVVGRSYHPPAPLIPFSVSDSPSPACSEHSSTRCVSP